MKKEVHSNPWYHIIREDYQTPLGKKGVYYGIRDLTTVMVVAVTKKNEVVLVKQWRYLFRQRMLEFPAGSKNKNETILQAAKRELQEETGYIAKAWKKITWFAPCNGLSDEHCTVFLAQNLILKKAQPENTEELVVEYYKISTIDDLIRKHIITDGMTLAAWQLVKPYL